MSTSDEIPYDCEDDLRMSDIGKKRLQKIRDTLNKAGNKRPITPESLHEIEEAIDEAEDFICKLLEDGII